MGKINTVAIIGGGVSGLSAGGLLSRKGLRVKLFEANDKLGGVAPTQKLTGTPFTMAPYTLRFPGFWSMSLRDWDWTALRSCRCGKLSQTN